MKVLTDQPLWYSPPVPADSSSRNPEASRHSALVRVTHWITVIAFLALLVTGVEIVISHPRFYWGEIGNPNVTPLFKLPIPASRDTVPTGYNYVLPDQNGWSRYLHFEAAWVAVITGLVYVIAGLYTRHFRNDLLPTRADRSWRAFRAVLSRSLRLAPTAGSRISLLQPRSANHVSDCDLRPLSPHNMDRARDVSRLRRRISRSRQPRSVAGNPRAPCTSSSPELSYSSSWFTSQWWFTQDSKAACGP